MTLVLLAAALAGCTHADTDDGNETRNGADPSLPGNGDDQTGPSLPPSFVQANLTVDAPVGWANDTFVFRGSVVEEGLNQTGLPAEAVVRYLFDAGEGTVVELDAPAEPVFNHTYSEGGLYIANLTVVALGHDNETVEDTATVWVFVQERHELADGALDAGYLVLAADDDDDFVYDVRLAATFFRVVIEISDEAVIGDSAGEVTFTDSEGNVLDTQAIDGDGTVTLSGAFNQTTGDHTLNVKLTSGEIEYSGTVTIYYGIDPDEYDLD